MKRTTTARSKAGAETSSFWGVAPHQRPSGSAAAETQRRRLMLGVTRAVLKKGYAGFSVADVINEVRISRKTFYQIFSDKEHCFLAAYDLVHQAMIAAIKESQRGVTDALARVEVAHRCFLGFMQEHPEAAMAFVVGIIEAGPELAERRRQALQDFAELHAVLHQQCRRQHAELPEVPLAAFVALAAGTNIIVIDELHRHGPAKVLELLPTVLYLTYSVYGLHALAHATAAASAHLQTRPRRHPGSHLLA